MCVDRFAVRFVNQMCGGFAVNGLVFEQGTSQRLEAASCSRRIRSTSSSMIWEVWSE